MSRPRSISCGRSIRFCRKPDAMLPPCHRSRYVPGTTMPTRTRTRPRRGVGRETLTARRLRVRRIVTRLEQAYPDATCALRHDSALQLLVATILSAHSTDARVNMVTPALFAKYRSTRDLASADPPALEQEVHSTGFFRNKTKSIIGMAQALLERHGGEGPAPMEALVRRPGAAAKTRNVE